MLAALLTACATFAPLYYQALRHAVTATTIAHSPAIEKSIQLWSSPASFRPAPVRAPEDLAEDLAPGVRESFAPPVLGYDGWAAVGPEGVGGPAGELIWRAGMCQHLTVVDGRCPNGPGEVAVSPADVENFHVAVGSSVRVGGAPDRSGRDEGNAPDQKFTVVGVYEQQESPAWFGRSLTGRSNVVAEGPPAFVQHDVWVTDRDTFTAPAWQVDLRSAYAGFVLDEDVVGADELASVGAEARRLPLMQPTVGTAPNQVVTGLGDLADGVQRQIEQAQVTVPLLIAQLCLLSLIVLWIVLLAITEQRRPEVVLARLRGRGRRGARALLYAELLPVSLAAVVPGVAISLLGSWLLTPRVLAGNPRVEIGPGFVAATLTAVVLLVLVTAVAVRRVAHEPVADLLRRVPPRSSGWRLGATDAVLIAGCGGVVVVFATGGLDGPAALGAPGLLAIVVGLVLAHLTAPSAARVGGRQLRRGRFLSGVSLLGAARSPSTRRIVAIVTLASALAVFSADTLVVGARNRAAASEQEAGAARVSSIRGNDLAAVRAALAEADPGGTRVTPVVRMRPPGASAASTLAVLPDGFRAVAFLGDLADDDGWDGLAAPRVAPVVLTGTSLTLDLDDSTLDSVGVGGTHRPVTVGLDLVTADGETLHTGLADLSRGTAHREVNRRVSCAEGCTVSGVWFSTLPAATMDGRVTLRLASGSGADPVDLGPAEDWSPYEDATTSVRPTSADAGELAVEVKSAGPSMVTLNHDWLPTAVPVLASASASDAVSGSAAVVAGVDGESRPAEVVGDIPRVPGATGTLVVNLETIARGSAVSPNVRIEAWFADADPALRDRVDGALADLGVEIGSTRTLRDARRGFDESVAAWSLQLAALVGMLAVLIALLVLVVSAASVWRLRTRDLAALRMSGVGSREIRRIAVATELPAVVVGVLAGCAAGLAGAHLAMPLVPLFAVTPAESTIDLDTAWGAVAVAAASVLLVLGTASVAIGRVLAGRAEVRRLRETL